MARLDVMPLSDGTMRHMVLCEARGHDQEAQPQRKAAQLERTVFYLQL